MQINMEKSNNIHSPITIRAISNQSMASAQKSNVPDFDLIIKQ